MGFFKQMGDMVISEMNKLDKNDNQEITKLN
jgi:hypothetical protein